MIVIAAVCSRAYNHAMHLYLRVQRALNALADTSATDSPQVAMSKLQTDIVPLFQAHLNNYSDFLPLWRATWVAWAGFTTYLYIVRAICYRVIAVYPSIDSLSTSPTPPDFQHCQLHLLQLVAAIVGSTHSGLGLATPRLICPISIIATLGVHFLAHDSDLRWRSGTWMGRRVPARRFPSAVPARQMAHGGDPHRVLRFRYPRLNWLPVLPRAIVRLSAARETAHVEAMVVLRSLGEAGRIKYVHGDA